MAQPTKEASIFLIGAILSELENDLHQYVSTLKGNPSNKQLYYIKRQERIIFQLADIYDTLSSFTLYEVCLEIQREYDKLSNPDGLFIKLPLRENPKEYVLIDFTI